MSEIVVEELNIRGCYCIRPTGASDYRGNMNKLYCSKDFDSLGINFSPSEVMIIKSKKGVLRGIHYQNENAQKKFIYCIHGEAFITVVDLRKESESFLKHVEMRLSAENVRGLIIPAGCGLGSLALDDSYICLMNEGDYFPNSDLGIRWDDEKLSIPWPLELVDGNVCVSEKDSNLIKLKDVKK